MRNYQQHVVAIQSLQMVPLMRKPVLNLALKLIRAPGIQNIQQLSPVRRNNLPNLNKKKLLIHLVSYAQENFFAYKAHWTKECACTITTIVAAVC